MIDQTTARLEAWEHIDSGKAHTPLNVIATLRRTSPCAECDAADHADLNGYGEPYCHLFFTHVDPAALIRCSERSK